MAKENQQGIILSVLGTREYGFLTPVGEEGKEIFFHKTAAPDWDQLEPGDYVTYTEVASAKGRRALRVYKTKPKPEPKLVIDVNGLTHK